MTPTAGSAGRRTAAAALCAMALAGCTAPVRLSRSDLMRDESSDDTVDGGLPPAPRPDAAPIAILPVEDRRPDPNSLGEVGNRSFGSSELKGWVDEQLAAVASPDFVVVKGPAPRPPRLTVRPRILKAYVGALDVTKSAVIVIEVEFVPAGGASVSRVFRGQDASLNWGNGQGEVTRALQRATAACLEQIRGDIEHRLRAGRA